MFVAPAVELPPPPPPPTPIHVQFLCYDPATDEAVSTVRGVSKEAADRFVGKLSEYAKGPLKSHGDMELAVRYRGELCDYYLGKGPLPTAPPTRACL